MLNFDLQTNKLTKTAYRKHIVDMFEATNKFPINNISDAISANRLLFELVKELYRIDNDNEDIE